MRALAPAAVALAAVALLLAACGDDPEPVDSETADIAVPADTLVMIDNAFQPQTWRVPPEGGSFTVENQGQALHSFTVEEAGIDEDVGSGEETTVELDLDPGEYEMICKYHFAQGMTGTIVVE